MIHRRRPQSKLCLSRLRAILAFAGPALLLAASAAARGDDPKAPEVDPSPTRLTFERPLARSYLVSVPKSLDLEALRSATDEEYPKKELKGTVVIAPDRHVVVYYQPFPPGPADLSFLDQFQPDDVYSLHVGATSVSAKELQRLQRHTALEYISLGPLNEASVADLAPLKEMPALASVTVTGPAVKGRVAKFVSQMQKSGALRALNLQDTETTDEDLVALRDSAELQVLSLQHTLVTDQGLKHLVRLSKLRELRLNRTGITDDGLRHLADLTELRYLDLAGTNVSGTGLRHLWKLRKLEKLLLLSSSLNDSGAKGLVGLKSLTELYAQKTKITDDALLHIGALPNLQWLDISQNDIRGTGLKHLMALKKLNHLDLALTSIGDDALQHLYPLKSLKYVLLPEKNVTRDGYEKLKAALPDTYVGSMDASLRKGKR